METPPPSPAEMHTHLAEDAKAARYSHDVLVAMMHILDDDKEEEALTLEKIPLLSHT